MAGRLGGRRRLAGRGDGSRRGQRPAGSAVRRSRRSREQVARTFSLDHDGRGWAEVGLRDPVIGRLQAEFDHLRPVCFYSPYEAAVQAVIGQRISMRRRPGSSSGWPSVSARGRTPAGSGCTRSRFPSGLVDLDGAPGLPAEKVVRLRGVAEAAIDGRLDAKRLRSQPIEEALATLRTIRGIGEWSSQHVLLRGAGVADAVPVADPRTRVAVRAAYDLPAEPTDDELTVIADAWRPFRMWGFVLVRLWHGRTVGGSLRQG